MDVCIYGTGAIGGFLAARLIAGGKAKVSVIARGPQLQAIKEKGLQLLSASGDAQGRPAYATDRPADLPPQDVVFVTLKAYALSAAVPDLLRLLKPEGFVVFVNNGIPWWWKHGQSKPAALPLLDPDGTLWNTLTPARSVGCVVYAPNEVIEPGVIRHNGPNRWILGEPDGALSPRLQGVVELMSAAGLGAEAATDLRREVWMKLLRNAPVNTLCALTRLPLSELALDPQAMVIADRIVDELTAVAAVHGSNIEEQAALTKESTRRGGGMPGKPPIKGMRPSMLQDALAGRPMEVDAILGQLQAFAAEAGIPCPAIDAVLPLIRGLDRSIRAAAA